jgi:uncharacterized OsmC-like protein
MMTCHVEYLGGLRTEAVHLQSGTLINTDAPKDNQGKGEAFSPTDLLATSLATCILTTIGIVAQRDGLTDMDGAKAEVLKVMYPDPRRVGEVHVKITFPKKGFSDKEKTIYQNTAHACPVSRSLHPDLKQVIEFVW